MRPVPSYIQYIPGHDHTEITPTYTGSLPKQRALHPPAYADDIAVFAENELDLQGAVTCSSQNDTGDYTYGAVLYRYTPEVFFFAGPRFHDRCNNNNKKKRTL